MPQATDQLRKKMAEYFPEGDGSEGSSGIADAPVYAYLAGLGLQEKGGYWMVPPDFGVTSKVMNCLNFMVDEWDYAWKWEGYVR
jgi:hypothetical protein